MGVNYINWAGYAGSHIVKIFVLEDVWKIKELTKKKHDLRWEFLYFLILRDDTLSIKSCFFKCNNKQLMLISFYAMINIFPLIQLDLGGLRPRSKLGVVK